MAATTLFEYEKQLVGEIARVVEPAVPRLADGAALNDMVDKVAGRIEEMIERNWPAPPEGKLLACRAGCAHC